MFGGGSAAGGNSGAGGQAQMISLAMQEASKLFDSQASQGNVAGGADKQSAIQMAAKMALQMYMKNQMGGAAAGAGAPASGGPGGLLGMASKFLS